MSQRVSTLSNPTERKYAASGLRPYGATGGDQARQPSAPMSQWHTASVCAASPALKIANELVHRFLLIGNTRPHARPTPVATTPAANSHSDRYGTRGSFNQSPAKTPHSAVAIAGSVLSRPSGSEGGVSR